MEILTTIKKNKEIPTKTLIKKDIKYPRYTDNNYILDEKEDESDNINDLIRLLVVDDNLEEINLGIKLTSKTQDKEIKFSISQLEHCCGIFELGDLRCDRGIPPTEIKKILDSFIKHNKGRTFIMNTNGAEHSRKFDSGLEISEYWTLVKSFKNRNSSNTIKVWLSNND